MFEPMLQANIEYVLIVSGVVPLVAVRIEKTLRVCGTRGWNAASQLVRKPLSIFLLSRAVDEGCKAMSGNWAMR